MKNQQNDDALLKETKKKSGKEKGERRKERRILLRQI
jgi:hypothetical protein